MSLVDVSKFCQISQEDRDLSEKLESLLGELDNINASYEDILDVADEITSLGKNYNLYFTNSELFNYLENECKHLTDEELFFVAGGISRKAASVGLSAIAILSLGTGALSFFNRNDENKVFKERNPAVLMKVSSDISSDNEDLYGSVNENKNFKGGKNNWRDLLKNFGRSNKNDVNLPSFFRKNPASFIENKTDKRKNLPKVYLKNQSDVELNLSSKSGNKQGSTLLSNGKTSDGTVINVKNSSDDEKKLTEVDNSKVMENEKNIDSFTNDGKKYSSNPHEEIFDRIENMGNDYNLNVAVQQLYYNSTFKNIVLSADVHGKNASHIKALKSLFEDISRKNISGENLQKFFDAFKDIYNEKQDSNEIYMKIISEVEKEGLNIQGVKVVTETSIYAQNDDQIKKLSEPVVEYNNSIYINVAENKDKKSLSNCFDKNGVYDSSILNDYDFKEEINDVEVRKDTQIIGFPNNLVINLNRYVYNKKTGGHKVTDTLEVPENINISKNKYKLKIVTIHTGNTDSDHYFLYVRNGITWLKMDNDVVEEVNYDEIKNEISRNATMVTYEKK